LKIINKRYFNTTCHIVSVNPTELRLETHNGIPNKRENIHNMFGTPELSEVTCLKANGTFFNIADPKSEIMGGGRGDCFLNVAWDGKYFMMEPEISKGLKEVSSSYALIRNGQRDHTNETKLKEILGRNPRMMMGQRANGEMVFIAADGRKLFEKGLTSEEERSVCSLEGLRYAVNNDGGGSTAIIVNDKQLNKAYDGRPLGYIWVGYRKWHKDELPSLKKGSKGMWVHLLQRILNLPADGNFGSGTNRAVRIYQQEHGFKVDGQVGPQTWEGLRTIYQV